MWIAVVAASACAARTGNDRASSGPSAFRLRPQDGGASAIRRDPSASARSSTSAPLRASERGSGPWRAYLFEPPGGFVQRRGFEADGTYYVTDGGLRVRVRPGSFSWASDVVLSGIVMATRAEQGWLFAAANGALYRAPYFTAPLERVGSTEAVPLRSAYIGAGRLSATDESARLWIGSSAGFSLWAPPDGARLVDAGFVTDRFGVAVASPGRLYRTLDGGAQWEPVSTQGHGVFEVLPEGDTFVLRTPDAQLRVDAQSAPAAFSGIALGSDSALSSAEATALRAASASEGPGARAAMFLQGAVSLGADRFYYSSTRTSNERFGSLFRSQAYAQDDLYLAVAGQLPTRIEPPGAPCRYAPWRDRLLAFCRDPAGYRGVLFSGDGLSPWSSIPTPGSLNVYNTAFATSLDGRTMFTLTVCDGATRTSNTMWCRYDGTRWATFEAERRATFVAAFGDHVVYRIAQGVFEQSVPGPLRVQNANAAPETARPPHRSDPRARIETGAFTEDGTFFARATIDDAVHLAIGPIDRELSIRPLPAEARDVSMATALRGIAAGDRLDRVWSTEDGGRTWQPLPLPLRGDGQGVLLVPETSDSEVRVRCTPSACTVANRIVWTSEALIGDPPPVVHSAPRVRPAELPAQSAARPRPPRTAMDLGTLRCAPEQSAAQPGYWFNSGGWVRPQPSNDGAAAWEWGGVDARGPYRVSAARAAAPLQNHSGGWSTTVVSYSPRVVSRSIALIERCSFVSNYGAGARARRCDIVRLTPRQAPQVWLDLLTVAEPMTTSTTPRLAEMIELPDHSVALRLANGALDDDALGGVGAGEQGVDLVLRLDAQGTVLERRGFAWAYNETRMRALAFDGASLGVLVLRQGARELQFYRSAEEPPRTLAPAPLRIQPCGTDPRPTTPFFVTSANEHNTHVRAGSSLVGVQLYRGEDSVQTVVELGSSGVCTRRVTAGHGALSSITPYYVPTQLGGALVLEASNGAFRAWSAAPNRRVPIDCVQDSIAP